MVLAPGSSSMLTAMQIRSLAYFAPAREDEIAAIAPGEGEGWLEWEASATRDAAALVEPTSTLSTLPGGRSAERKLLHWPQTWGCVYSVLMSSFFKTCPSFEDARMVPELAVWCRPFRVAAIDVSRSDSSGLKGNAPSSS